MKSIEPGIYKHYKGNTYRVLGTAFHTETKEECVLYQPMYECEYPYFVRPLAMFAESVSINGASVERFTYIGPYEKSS